MSNKKLSITSANSRIARNSLFMSVRMVFVLGLTLYTTRVVLSILGIEDYGIYNVVCGFVSMFAFLNVSMSNGIQRFYNYELGKNGVQGANKVYNTSLLIQLIITMIIVLLTESVGVWYLHNKMVIPENRMMSAEFILQFSILSFVFVIMQAPYTAAVMAHEKMDFYAVISVADAVLRFVIVFIVPYCYSDNLFIYGLLISTISIFDFLVYFIYCKKHFEEIRLVRSFDKEFFSSMVGFSGWNVFGSFAGIMREQGVNLILNLFFGPVVNAARAVAYQVNGGLQSFVTNITIPVRPQVIQSYAVGDIDRTMKLTYTISKFSCFFLFVVSLPIILEIDYILKIWIGGNVPEHTAAFVVIVVIQSFFNNLNAAVSGVVHASGRMKLYQLSGCCVNLLTLPVAYILLLFVPNAELALSVVLFFTILVQVVALFVMKTIVEYKFIDYLEIVILPIIEVVLIGSIIPFVIHYNMPSSFARLLVVSSLSLIITVCVIYTVGCNQVEKAMIKKMAGSLTMKFRNKYE